MDHDTPSSDTWSLSTMTLVLTSLVFAVCAGFFLLTISLPDALPSAKVTVTTAEGCREISLGWDERTWRSREFPENWGPGTTHTGELREREPGVAVLRTDDGEAVFVAGEAFTMDCPLYPGDVVVPG